MKFPMTTVDTEQPAARIDLFVCRFAMTVHSALVSTVITKNPRCQARVFLFWVLLLQRLLFRIALPGISATPLR